MLLSSEPSELPAISSWLFAGSTANPKIAECPWCGSGFKAYREALAAMKPEHPRRARTVESLLTALQTNKSYKDCVEVAIAEAPKLPRGPSYVNSIYLGLSCQQEADAKEP